jgi:hypothetical protein
LRAQRVLARRPSHQGVRPLLLHVEPAHHHHCLNVQPPPPPPRRDPRKTPYQANTTRAFEPRFAHLKTTTQLDGRPEQGVQPCTAPSPALCPLSPVPQAPDGGDGGPTGEAPNSSLAGRARTEWGRDSLDLPILAVVLAVLRRGLRRFVDDRLAPFEDAGVQARAGIHVARTPHTADPGHTHNDCRGRSAIRCRRPRGRLRQPPARAQHGRSGLLKRTCSFFFSFFFGDLAGGLNPQRPAAKGERKGVLPLCAPRRPRRAPHVRAG